MAKFNEVTIPHFWILISGRKRAKLKPRVYVILEHLCLNWVIHTSSLKSSNTKEKLGYRGWTRGDSICIWKRISKEPLCLNTFRDGRWTEEKEEQWGRRWRRKQSADVIKLIVSGRTRVANEVSRTHEIDETVDRIKAAPFTAWTVTGRTRSSSADQSGKPEFLKRFFLGFKGFKKVLYYKTEHESRPQKHTKNILYTVRPSPFRGLQRTKLHALL